MTNVNLEDAWKSGFLMTQEKATHVGIERVLKEIGEFGKSKNEQQSSM